MQSFSGGHRHRSTDIFVVLLLLGCLTLVPTPLCLAGDNDAPGGDGTKGQVLADETVVSPAPTLLPGITITDTREQSERPAATISHDDIERMPVHNNSIQELLRVLPGVQLSERNNLSTQGGELNPPPVSLSGGKVDQNSFLVDGMSIDSRLDPLAKNPNDIDSIPGDPQALFIDPDLVEKLTLYDFDVPARYGKFTGGAVVMETRNPAAEFSGKLKWRTTRRGWTQYHLDAAEQPLFNNSTDYYRQPDTSKDEGGIMVSLPLSESSGLLVDHQRSASRIPLYLLGQRHLEHRRNENTYIKWVTTLPHGAELKASYLHAPSTGDYFIKNALNSDFTITKGGDNLLLDYLREVAGGHLELRAGYQLSQNSRSGPDEWHSWAVAPHKDWGALIGAQLSTEGGFGDVKSQQQSATVAAHWTAPEVIGSLGQQLAFGTEYARLSASYERKNTLYVYYPAILNSALVCAGDDLACIDGEQYHNTRHVYAANQTTASSQQFSGYLQDTVVWQSFSFRPGGRVDYDDYTGNLNVAPRFSGSWRVADENKATLTIGLNRYYGSIPLTDGLRDGQPPKWTESRALINNTPGPWQFSAAETNLNRRAQLKTPYTDEAAIAWQQLLGGGKLQLVAIHRRGRDELAFSREVQSSGQTHITFNNRGRSRYRSYRLDWQRNWSRQALGFKINWQESQTDGEGYNTLNDPRALNYDVWYRGRPIDRSELPRNNFNRPYTGTLVYSCRLPWGGEFSNITTYRSSFDSLANTGPNIVIDGNVYEVYEVKKVKASLLFDWTLRWHLPLTSSQTLTLTADILNVFNQRVEVASEDSFERYEIGRQFWAGVEYTF